AVLLADALGRLPADYREVLILRHLEGLTFPEVAARMGRSLDSVEKLWARALPRLRRAFGDEPRTRRKTTTPPAATLLARTPPARWRPCASTRPPSTPAAARRAGTSSRATQTSPS